jgi:phosphoglycerate dehydrogenase-like enzyme
MPPQDVVLVGSMDFFFNPVADAVTAIGHKAIRYRAHPDFLADKNALDTASVLYAVGYCPVTREAMSRAPKLRAVICPWTGTDGFDTRAATDLGILIGNGQFPENTDSMAEATVLMILATLYDLDGTRARFREADNWAVAHLTARMLKGKTIGLYGYGGMARGIVERLQAWGVNFCATTRHPPADATSVRFLPLEDMLKASDVVCVLTPLTDETKGQFSAARLALMKRGSVLICTSRGGIIDEAALLALVNDGHFSAVGLDVFAQEPLPKDSPMRALKNAILTPHSVGHTQEMRKRMVDTGVASVLRVLEGEPPLHVCNPEILDAWSTKWKTR